MPEIYEINQTKGLRNPLSLTYQTFCELIDMVIWCPGIRPMTARTAAAGSLPGYGIKKKPLKKVDAIARKRFQR